MAPNAPPGPSHVDGFRRVFLGADSDFFVPKKTSSAKVGKMGVFGLFFVPK